MVEGEAVAVTEIGVEEDTVVVVGVAVAMMVVVAEAVEVGIMTEAAVVETGRGIRKKSSTVR